MPWEGEEPLWAIELPETIGRMDAKAHNHMLLAVADNFKYFHEGREMAWDSIKGNSLAD